MAISFQLSASEDNPKMNLKDYMAYATDKLLSISPRETNVFLSDNTRVLADSFVVFLCCLGMMVNNRSF